MSEQIREQVSAFLDGELPNTETELLLKRMTRDVELRNGFGRYALIGEAMRGTTHGHLSRQFLERVNRAVDGEPAVSAPPVREASGARWWRPLAGVGVAAGVAAIAIVALQQRAAAPEIAATGAPTGVVTQVAAVQEPVSYTTPALTAGSAALSATPAAYPAARMTQYVFAHSKYSSVLGQSNVISGLLTDADEQEAAAVGGGSGTLPQTHKAP